MENLKKIHRGGIVSGEGRFIRKDAHGIMIRGGLIGGQMTSDLSTKINPGLRKV